MGSDAQRTSVALAASTTPMGTKPLPVTKARSVVAVKRYQVTAPAVQAGASMRCVPIGVTALAPSRSGKAVPQDSPGPGSISRARTVIAPSKSPRACPAAHT